MRQLRYQVLPDLRRKWTGESLIIFHPDTDFLFRATPEVEQFLQFCDGSRTLGEACSEFLRQSGVPTAELEAVVEVLVSERIIVPLEGES